MKYIMWSLFIGAIFAINVWLLWALIVPFVAAGFQGWRNYQSTGDEYRRRVGVAVYLLTILTFATWVMWGLIK